VMGGLLHGVVTGVAGRMMAKDKTFAFRFWERKTKLSWIGLCMRITWNICSHNFPLKVIVNGDRAAHQSPGHGRIVPYTEAKKRECVIPRPKSD
jgi:hypothetical protein